MTVEEVARLLGVCKRRILTEYLRLGLLPWPEPGALFRRDAVEALAARFEAKRRS